MEYFKTAMQTAKKNADTVCNGIRGKRGAVLDYSILRSAELPEEVITAIVNKIAESDYFKKADVVTDLDFFEVPYDEDDATVTATLEFDRIIIRNSEGDKLYIVYKISGIKCAFFHCNYYGFVVDPAYKTAEAGRWYEDILPMREIEIA